MVGNRKVKAKLRIRCILKWAGVGLCVVIVLA